MTNPAKTQQAEQERQTIVSLIVQKLKSDSISQARRQKLLVASLEDYLDHVQQTNAVERNISSNINHGCDNAVQTEQQQFYHEIQLEKFDLDSSCNSSTDRPAQIDRFNQFLANFTSLTAKEEFIRQLK